MKIDDMKDKTDRLNGVLGDDAEYIVLILDRSTGNVNMIAVGNDEATLASMLDIAPTMKDRLGDDPQPPNRIAA